MSKAQNGIDSHSIPYNRSITLFSARCRTHRVCTPILSACIYSLDEGAPRSTTSTSTGRTESSVALTQPWYTTAHTIVNKVCALYTSDTVGVTIIKYPPMGEWTGSYLLVLAIGIPATKPSSSAPAQVLRSRDTPTPSKQATVAVHRQTGDRCANAGCLRRNYDHSCTCVLFKYFAK